MSKTKFKKGDIVRYTGPYAEGVTYHYGPGEIVGFREYRTKVTVRLIEETDDLYADWPVDEIAPKETEETK